MYRKVPRVRIPPHPPFAYFPAREQLAINQAGEISMFHNPSHNKPPNIPSVVESTTCRAEEELIVLVANSALVTAAMAAILVPTPSVASGIMFVAD